MSLDPRYVTAPSLQEYFVNKDSGLPLSGGKVYFYRDQFRTQLKSVYELQGNQANYTYSPLPNPVILSAVGTIQDNNGNDVIPYYYPYDANGDVDLYYIVVQDSLGVPQFTRQAWPNPGFDNIPSSADNLINYIPNGQLLAHINQPADTTPPYRLQAGTNVIAQGGFTIELANPLTSVNTLEFITEQFTQEPPQSPRYLMQFTCSTFLGTETIKNIRIKWTDVNKFSTKPGVYTFAFWAVSNVALPVSINLVKYFGTGGSAFTPEVIALKDISTDSTNSLYQFTVNFGLNNGYVVGALQDDFVAIDIAMPTNIAFQASFTDFVLSDGDVNILNFPVQTDADMMARGVMGWADKIDPAGSQLYLPPILTEKGMTWDTSQIGEIGMSVGPILSPNSTSPIPSDNRMPADGASYLFSGSASNGIPFSRLGNYLRSINPSGDGIGLYGTGANYVSTLVNLSGSDGASFRITWNMAGAGSPQAADGAVATGWAFSPIYIYNGSTTGEAAPNTWCSNTGTPNILLYKLNNQGLTALSKVDDGTTGFVITQLSVPDSYTSLLSFQANDCAALITTTSGAALSVSVGGAGQYFDFADNATQYRMWFNATGSQAAPAAGGRVLIQVNIDTSYTTADVANVVREAILGYQSTFITVNSVPNAQAITNISPYFTFSSNPGALRNFYVWFRITGALVESVDPAPAGLTGILVTLPASPSFVQIRDTIRATINSYQFAAPDFEGLFPRFADPNSSYDFDSLYRWSNVPGLGGNLPGTFELSQFLHHTHLPATDTMNAAGTAGYFQLGATGSLSGASQQSGGTETRPVNTIFYGFIRY